MVTSRKKLESEGFRVGPTRESKSQRKKGRKKFGIISCTCDKRSDSRGKFGDGSLAGEDCKCSISSGARSFRVAKKIADNPEANLEGLGSETKIPTRELKGVNFVFIQKGKGN